MSSVLEDLKNSFSRTSNGLNQIILINVIVFIVLIFLKVFLTISGFSEIYHTITNQLLLPASIDQFIYKPWTLLSYFFTHEGFFHIIFNMLALYWFGLLITEFLGSKRLISLFMFGGVAGGLTYLLMYNTIPYFADRAHYTALLGASGGVYAVVVGAAVLLPDYTFFMLFLGPVKIKWIAAFYLLLSLAESIGPNAGGNLAHLGGAGLGALYIWQLRQGNDFGRPFELFFNWVGNIFKPKPKIKISYKNTDKKTSSHSQSYDNVSQDEIDAILDKISKFGYEKLTKEEKQKLFKASQSTHI
jgi:membrane associated rhomboid family serine protease